MATAKTRKSYAICLANDGCDDLHVRQMYRVIPDMRSERAGLLRIVDDSGEDYLYPKRMFARISVRPDHRSRIEKLFPNGGSTIRAKSHRAMDERSNAKSN